MRENPLCYAIYEKNVICQASYKNIYGEYECTILTDTDSERDDCPFFLPICIHRENDENGFMSCPIREECTGTECYFYEPKGEEE